MRKKVGDLIVRAPVDGQLTSLDAEIGQSKNKGERLGQIDVISGFKVRVDVDEHYISRIFIGLKGEFTFAGKDYILVIKKVFTQVTNGTFQVDMEFVGRSTTGYPARANPADRLALSDEIAGRAGCQRAVSTNKPAATGFLKFRKMAKSAYKVDIQLGQAKSGLL